MAPLSPHKRLMTENIHDKCLKEISYLNQDVKYWREFGSFFIGEYCKAHDVGLADAWVLFEEWHDSKYLDKGEDASGVQ